MKTLALLLAMLLAAGALLTAGPSGAEDTDLLRGTVTDVNGKPVAGAEVTLYRGKNVKKPADFASPRTGPDGLYTVTAPPGHYWAVAMLRQGERRFGPLELGDKYSGEAVEVEIKAGAKARQDFVVMDLREAAQQHRKRNKDLVRLRGRILDRNGRPLALAYAVADRQPQFKELPAYLSAWTDASGDYILLLPPGKYYLAAQTGFPPAPELTLGQEVTLTADTDGVDLKTATEAQAIAEPTGEPPDAP